jgi:NAD(P)-dependent dehydrogenase (short-subunit alcohol dehydrogenase family)
VTLDGKVAIVTGAGGGIGSVYCRALADAGARVVLADVNLGAARSAAEEVDSGLPVQVDVTSQASCDAMAAAALEHFGSIDILVNNAALMAEVDTPNVLKLPAEQWDRILDVNLTGPLRCVRSCAPAMKERGYGKIVNQSSGGAFQPSGAYGVSKLALVSLTATLARELARKGVRVNAIAPGFTNTAAGNKATPDEMRMFIQATVPFPFGEPEDLVGALLYLCGSESDWMTGQTLNVDGGWISRL